MAFRPSLQLERDYTIVLVNVKVFHQNEVVNLQLNENTTLKELKEMLDRQLITQTPIGESFRGHFSWNEDDNVIGRTYNKGKRKGKDADIGDKGKGTATKKRRRED